MDSPQQLQKLSLSIIDQTAFRFYVRLVMCFELDDAYAEQAVDRLRKGVMAVVALWPFLAGHVTQIDDQVGEAKGEVAVYYSRSVDSLRDTLFTVKRHTDFPHTYKDLKARGMPAEVLRGDRFTTPSYKSIRSVPADVMSIKVNLISGGLLLGFCFHHSVVDGAGAGTILDRLAGFVRNGVNPSDVKTDDSSLIRGEFPYKNSHQDATLDELAQDCPERKLCSPYEGDVIPTTTTDWHETAGRIFHFSDERIKKLKRAVVEHVGPSYVVTTHGIVSALIWIFITRVRSYRMDIGWTKFCMAVNIRNRIDPRVPEQYLGNCVAIISTLQHSADFAGNFVSPRTYTTLFSGDSDRNTEKLVSVVAEAAKTIRASTEAVDEEWVAKRLRLIHALPHVQGFRFNYRARFGHDVFLTSWASFGADAAFELPGTTTSCAEFIRKPWTMEDGACVILPRSSSVTGGGGEAPWEVFVQLRRDDMDVLCGSDELGAIADSIIQ